MKFRMKAVDAQGKQHSIKLTAENEAAALALAKSKGFFPTEVNEEPWSDLREKPTLGDPLPRTPVESPFDGGVKLIIALVAFTFVLVYALFNSLIISLTISLLAAIGMAIAAATIMVAHHERNQFREKYDQFLRETNYERKTALAEEILTVIDSKSDDEWRKLGSSNYIHWRRTIEADLSAAHPKVESPTVRQLAELRGEGLLSEDEFKAFYDRFGKSTGEKAQEIILAIEKLHKQYRSGAMTEGNYHSALWSLLDKLDRKTS